MPRIPRASPGAACNYAFQPYSELCCFPCLSSTSTLKAARPPWLCATMPSSSPTCLRGTSFLHSFGPRQGLRRPCPRSHDLGCLQKVTLCPLIALQLIVHKHTVQCRRTSPHDKTPPSHLRIAVMKRKLSAQEISPTLFQEAILSTSAITSQTC